MNSKIIKLEKKYKNAKEILIENKNIVLPTYVKNSISKYRFNVQEEKIILERFCNRCNTFFPVQIVDSTNTLVNLVDIPFRYIGAKSGFHNICNNCIKSKSNNTSKINSEIQLNIQIDIDLKNYYKVLAIKNNTSLKKEILNALTSYKQIPTKK